MEEWHWEGSNRSFVGIVRWAIVYHQIGKDKPEGWVDMLTDPDMMSQKAKEYGITAKALVHEMLRISTALNEEFAEIDSLIADLEAYDKVCREVYGTGDGDKKPNDCYNDN